MRVSVLLLSGWLTLLIAAPSSAQGIAGCVTLAAQKPVAPERPAARATINVRRGDQLFATVADEQGCYELKPLAPGLYRVTARLKYLDNMTRANIRVVPGQMQRVDLALRRSPTCDCGGPPTTLHGLWQEAAAVVYLRIRENLEQVSTPWSYFKHTADLLEVLKTHEAEGPPDRATRSLQRLLRNDPSLGSIQTPKMTFGQDQSTGAPDPSVEGEELIVFLTWYEAQRMFLSGTMTTEGRSDQAATFLIHNRRVARSPDSLSRYTGGDVESLLTDLRRFTTRK